MRIKETKVYQFSELSDKAKESAVNNMANINIDYEWWENTFYDAEHTALLRITSFDTDRDCSGDFIEYAEDTAKKIIAEHGEQCETYQTATNYLKECAELQQQYPEKLDEDLDDLNKYTREQAREEIDDEFLKSILEDYWIILRKEYEYLSSEEAIIETIEANEYEFTEDGEIA